MNKDNFRTLVRNIDSDLFELINHVICSICQELLTKPVTTPCGHTFCSGCIKRFISSKDNSGCPLCKNPVKRYCLETDKVKSTLTEIFRELPAAFEKDVKDLSADLNDTTEDLFKNSKLAQLSGQDYEKDVKSTKQKTSSTKKSQKRNKSENTEGNDNDVDTFVPVLKRSKNVIEYASAKKKKMDDLISISQREVESDFGVGDTSELDKKFEQIEKVSPEEKVNEWFKAVGSNIYLGSPGSNYLDLPPAKNVMESQSFSKDAKEGASTNNSSTMVRRDYKKVANPLHSKENEKESEAKVVVDPYEFVPSQNKKIGRRRGRRCVEKKIPDFKAIQSFTKESIKRNAVISNEDKEDGEEENEGEVSIGNDKPSSELPAMAMTPDVITASQKFDKLLSESKENEKKEVAKAHVLYSASQASSLQFLDCSYQSPVAEVKKVPKKRRSRANFKKNRKSVSPSEKESFSNLIPNRARFSTNCPNTGTKTVDGEGSTRSKRKNSLDGDEAKADERQSFSEIMDLKSEEALDLEKSVEEYLLKFRKDTKSPKGRSCDTTSQHTKTKLIELLGELANDDVVYKNRPRNAPVELKNQRKAEEKDSEAACKKISQQTKTKLTELLEELVNDDTVYKNHVRNTPEEAKNRRKAEDRGKDSKVISYEKTSKQNKTILMELLVELVNDDVVYKNHPSNAPVEMKKPRKAEDGLEKPTLNKSLPNHTSQQHQNIGDNSKLSGRKETTKPIDDLKSGNLTQGTHLLGFGTQEELVDEKMFKEMVKNMEKELELSESELKRTPLEQCNEERDDVMRKALNNSYDKESPSSNSRNELANSNFIRFNCLGKIRRNKNCFINFLRLGRLTPAVKRSRGSVVKLVFPIGFSSFAKKRAIQDTVPKNTNTLKSLLSINENSLRNEALVPSSRNDRVSTGIQTSQKLVSSAEVQTSQISKSVIVQTSQVMKPSVETPTVKENCCVGIQTSQMPSPEKSRAYKSAEIQTSQCEALLRDNPNDIETEYIPGSVGDDEPKILSKKNISRNFEESEFSFRKLRSSKDRTSSLEKEIEESPSRLSNKTKRKSLSPLKKPFYKHRKISNKTEIEKKSPSPESKSPKKTQDGIFQGKPCTSSLIVDSEMKMEFEETWVRKSQEDLVDSKNKRNRGEEEAVSRESEISSPTEEKPNPSLTQNLSGLIDEVLQRFETRQRIPLDVKRVSFDDDDDYEMVDLTTPEPVKQSSQEQVFQVLKNIDLDLKGKEDKKGNGKEESMSENLGSCKKDEKSEESDSDFFVEQTPPRPSNSRLVEQEPVNSSKFDGRKSSYLENVEREEEDGKKAPNSQGTDLIGDSLPKDVPETESYLMVSAPQKVILTPEKKESSNVSFLEKRGKSGSQSFPKEKSFSTVQKIENFPKANENDQNQLNGASETKPNQLRLKVEESPHVKARQKLCVVASSVKNLDMIKKFVIKFKMEYSNKPTKNMTHLIVGLHESEEESEVLPLCTPKLLFAMANKKWIVSEAWAEACLKMDAILPEETFEALDPVGGQGCRNARLSTQPLLKDCEIYLLGNFQAISKEDFAGLILDCGGTVIQKPEQFSFSPLKLRMIVADQDSLNMDKNQMQELHEKYSTVILSRDVILMSIQSYKLANFIPHLLYPTSEEELLKMGYPSQLVKSEEEDSSCSNWNNSRYINN